MTREPALVDAAIGLRTAVFVEEQGVDPTIEVDGRDADADHAVVLDEAAGRPDAPPELLATGRLLVVDAVARIGRVAVRRDRRGERLGEQVMRALEERASALGLAVVELHAQLGVRGFYERLGYVAVGEPYVEAGIDHVTMRKELRAG